MLREFTWARALLWLGTLWLPYGATPAAERMARQISDIPGMPVGMTDVGQDTTGYLWISSSEGLDRYDGFEVRNWGEVPGRLTYVSTGPQDRVLGGDPRTGLYEVDGVALRRIEGPADISTAGPQHAIYDGDGRLWAAWDGRLLRREDGGWIDVGPEDIAEDHAFSLARRDDGGVLVGSSSGDVWIVDASDAARRIARDIGGWIMQVHDDPRGPVAWVRAGEHPGFVRITRDGVDSLLLWASRTDGLARRGSTYWIATSTGVWAVRDDGSRELLTPKDGFAGFGNITTDREDGLWVAGVRGLSHFPQPDTVIWTELSGLPHTYLRGVHSVPGGYVVTSWRGPMWFDGNGHARELDLGDLFSRYTACSDPWGGVWLKAVRKPPGVYELNTDWSSDAVLVEWRNGRSHVRRDHRAWYGGELACDEGPDGSFWLLANGELLEVAGPGAEPKLRARLPAGTSDRRVQAALAILPDRGSVIVVFYDNETCEAPMPAPGRTLEGGDWTCEGFTEGGGLLDVLETGSGRLWLAADDGGVFEETEGGWRRVPGELAEMHEAKALEPAVSGGVWVIGWRDRWRVEERPSGAPPAVVERLTRAHGIPDWQNGHDLLEEPDGTLWIPLYSGLVRVPAEVRRQLGTAPAVTLTRLVADGRQVPTDGPLELRHGSNSLEIRWATLSFRDPTQIRYRMRTGSDSEWSVLTQPFVRLAGLGSGRHRVELSASLDGRSWSERPAVVRVDVRPAWYRQNWVLLLATAAASGLLYVSYRLRLAHLLRLERQRTRIAMDLHDEMGAGLGSAGLLVGLLSEGDLDAEERRTIGGRAVQQIRDLGGSLGDIVWSLRPGTETLDALLLFLRQRASDLFPAGGQVVVNVDAPEPCPALRLTLPQRRNLQWIAVEALHNAARHADAKRIVMKLRPEGDAWVLSVRDDGRGFSGADVNGSGLGQESMQRRAQEIGAELDVRSEPGEGTTVRVRFRTKGQRR